MYIKIPSINPYDFQKRMFKAVLDDKNICAVIHRRAGKDIFCLEAWVLRGLRRIGTHVYLFPLYAQARSVIWNGMDFHGRPFLSAIPEALVLHKNQARMEITLFNGSRLILAGSNNYDSLMGTNPVTIIYSEFALHNPLARQYLNPILLQNKGLEIINSTPRGMNHLWEFYNTVKDNDRYHVEHLSIDQTHKHDGSPIFTQDDLKEAKAMGMSEEMIRQELYCDFEVGNLGAYYTREMTDMEREGRIMLLKPDPRLKLHSVWDLGGTDATAGILFQITGKYVHLLYLLHNTGKGLKFYLDEAERVRQNFQCEWGNHFMPHDVKQKHQGWEHTESRIVQARKHGWHFQVTPLVNVEDGIEAVRYMLPRIRADKINCALWVRAMREFQREFNDAKQRFEPKAYDNWAIHIADATRYLAVQYKRLYDIPQAPSTYSTSF